MDPVEQVHIFGLTNIHVFEPNNNLIRLFSLIFNYAKLRIMRKYKDLKGINKDCNKCVIIYCHIVSAVLNYINIIQHDNQAQSLVLQGMRA